jgi:signal transduction histidine kinase
MSKTSIRFSSDILRRLGEELNPSMDKGILELVKNSHDADATECKVQLLDASQGGTIRISDNGFGMSEKDIENGWLVLGSSRKTKNRTPKGRIPAGSKGLGRLAALRMGHLAKLKTRPQEEFLSEYYVEIDWDKYEGKRLVEDVSLTISKTPSDVGFGGTEITIEKLRHQITKTDVKRLARELILLADPFADSKYGFFPVLVAPEFKDLESQVKRRYFQDADYHLIAEIRPNGHLSTIVYDWKENVLFEASESDLQPPYNAPKMKFELWVFILSGQSFSSRSVSIGEVKEWLNSFGGVHLYQNGLRVSPYGDKGNDWLDMNLQRSRSPEERPSTNTVIGRVTIDDREELLVQKTDRSGFIETETFRDVKRFCQDVLNWLAKRRLDVAEKRRRKSRVEAPKESADEKVALEKAIEHAPPEVKTSITKALKQYDQAKEKELVTLKQDVQLYRTLSTAGITSATFAHDSHGNPIKLAYQAFGLIKTRIKKLLKGTFSKDLDAQFDQLARSLESLSVLGKTTLKLVDHEKRRTGSVPVNETIQAAVDDFKDYFRGRDIEVSVVLSSINPVIYANEAALESIIFNLLTNSSTALEDISDRPRKVEITSEVVSAENGAEVKISVRDTGNGIKGIKLNDIWLPGQTTRKNGTGLGLTIVRDTVEDLGGRVDVTANGVLGGAEFYVYLPHLEK